MLLDAPDTEVPGGKSTDDAAGSISQRPAEVQRKVVPAIGARLDQTHAFATMPHRGLVVPCARFLDSSLFFLKSFVRTVIILSRF